jgi:hypothetical protein
VQGFPGQTDCLESRAQQPNDVRAALNWHP